MIKNIFFDLDGTLLGMDPKRFMRLYTESLAKKLSDAGYNGAVLVDAVVKGTLDMFANAGAETNDRAFWRGFTARTGIAEDELKPLMSEYYSNEFFAAREATHRFTESEEIVRTLQKKGYRLFLTTNAVFPMEAIRSRCEWGGIPLDAFEYATVYDNSSYCKPNALYFKEVLDRFSLDASETLLIGNDREEDCAIETWGCACILTAEHLMNLKNLPMDGRRVLSHAELLDFVKNEL